MVLQADSLDHVYFVHPSTDISVDISTNISVECQSTYRTMLDRYVGRHVDRHSAAISVDILTDISTKISADILANTRPICWSIRRPRVVVQQSADKLIDRLPTFHRYVTATCVLVTVA